MKDANLYKTISMVRLSRYGRKSIGVAGFGDGLNGFLPDDSMKDDHEYNSAYECGKEEKEHYDEYRKQQAQYGSQSGGNKRNHPQQNNGDAGDNRPSIQAIGSGGSGTSPEKPKEKVRFSPPTIEDVRQDFMGDIQADSFFDFYASKGWKVGSAPMKDWKAAARNWRRKNGETQKQIGAPKIYDPARKAM